MPAGSCGIGAFSGPLCAMCLHVLLGLGMYIHTVNLIDVCDLHAGWMHLPTDGPLNLRCIHMLLCPACTVYTI